MRALNEWKKVRIKIRIRIRREYKNKYIMRMKWWIWTENWIGAEGAMMISEVLKTNTTLTKLDLRSDEICNCKINHPVVQHMTLLIIQKQLKCFQGRESFMNNITNR